ncbi:hypothetical protein [Pseudomonas retamae]|uniref:YncE family protein n=1 Tax=Pseudomonas retamae TaxID=702110 RepID=A0ABW7DJ93_9PSED
MSTSTPPDNTVLVLSSPKINGETKPVVGADIGVSLVAYDLINDGEGAVVLVDPPLSGTLDPDDVMELWLEGESAALDSETIIDVNARTTLRIPKGRLHPDRINKLYYTITRGSNNVGTSEPPLEILYNRIRPGLKDKLTDPGGHSELKLILPDTIKNGVGPGFVSAEICVAYPYCRAYDLITLKCNGELLEPKPRVNPNQAPTPPNPGSEVPITICFTITRDFLDKAKRLDKKLNFLFTVTDQLGNGPDTDAPWSPVQTVDEDLDGRLLPMPILREVPSDENDNPGIIDLVKLAGEDLSVVVLTSDARFVVGHDVIATYTAKNTGQPADVVVVVSGKVEQEFGQKIPCVLEIPNDQIFASSVVTVTYELREPDGDLVGISNAANATVTGAAPIKLLPPALVDVVEPIDVLAYPNGVTVRIRFPEALLGDRARLVEVNAPAGEPQFPLEDFVDQQVNVVLSQAFLAARHDKETTLRWNLNRNASQVGRSASVKVSVLKITDGDSRLPAFRIDEANGESHVLNLRDFQGNCTVSIAPSPLIIEGHHLWLDVVLNKTLTQPIVISLARGDLITAEEQNTGVRRTLLRSDLENLPHESTLELVPKIFFGSNPTEEYSTKLPTTDYTLHNQTLFIEEDFSNVASHKLNVGQSINIGTMTITNMREDSVSGDYTGIGHPLTADWGSQCLKIRDTIKIDLNGKTATEIDCNVLNSQTNNGITFYNAAGILIHSVADLTKVPIKLTNNLKFSSLIIATQIVPGSGGLRDYLDIDNIKITLSI